MRIGSISNAPKTFNSHKRVISPISADKFYEKNNVSFTALYNEREKFKYTVDPAKLISLAESYYNESDEYIHTLCKGACLSKKKGEEFFENVMPYVKEVRNKMDSLQEGIDYLGVIITDGLCDAIKEKMRIKNEFINLVEMEKRGVELPVPGGILIYGNSKKDIDDFKEYITNCSGTCICNTDYDPSNPFGLISDIVNLATIAELQYDKTKTRTILAIDGLDDFLSNYDSIESRGLIGRFKGLVENISKKYHTTILMTTTRPLGEFEQASIASHRFPIKLNISRKIATDEDKAKYEEAKNEFQRIYNKAHNMVERDDEYWVEGYGNIRVID